MPQFFDGIRTRLDAVVSGGRGADGSLGSDALNRSLPAGRFTATVNDAPVTDTAVTGGMVDRSYAWMWLGIADEPGPNNDYQSTQVRKCRVGLEVAYVYGAAAQSFVDVAAGTGETQASAIASTRERALSDAERIRRALCFTGLTVNTGTGDIDPAIVGVYRDGESVLLDLGRGKLVCRTPFVVLVQANATTVYDP